MRVAEPQHLADTAEPVDQAAVERIVRGTQLLIAGELRKHVRIPIVLEVEFKPDSAAAIVGLTRELSYGGLSIMTPAEISPDHSGEVVLKLPSGQKIKTRATVVWRHHPDLHHVGAMIETWKTRTWRHRDAELLPQAIAPKLQLLDRRAKHVLEEHREQLETLAKALLEYETLSGDEIKNLLAGGTIDRGGFTGPAIPSAGSSIPKAKRPKAGIGGPAAAGA